MFKHEFSLRCFIIDTINSFDENFDITAPVNLMFDSHGSKGMYYIGRNSLVFVHFFNIWPKITFRIELDKIDDQNPDFSLHSTMDN